MIGEVVADALDAAVVGDDAATVAVDQAANEVLGGLIDKLLLPGFQPDRPVVLLAGPMLREEARPVLGVEGDHDAALLHSLDRCVLSGHDRVDCLLAAVNDAGVLLVQRDPQPPDATHSGDASVTEVETE